MNKIKRSLGVLAAIAFAAMSITSGSALAATQPTVKTKAQWRAAISRLRQPGSGCFNASYPALKWHAVKCVSRTEGTPGTGTAIRISKARRAADGR